jgi:succinate dehydrogenase / fumarate reductase flavoprotein subunit
MIRTLQYHAMHQPIDVFMECTVIGLLKDDDRIAGAVAYRRETGAFVVYHAKAVVLATGGIGKSYKITSNSWEYTGDGHALALWAGADLIDMEFVQFHPTGMVWPPSVRGILVTEGIRGDGGALKNRLGRRFMFDYVPEMFRSETADTEAEADRWYSDKVNARRTPDLLPRDEVARAINSEVKAGRGTPHGGVYLDIASRRPADYIKRRLPGMYQQFKELADVDITKEAMEVGPTCHYMMGGVRVDAETQESTVPGCTGRTVSGAIRSPICWCSAGAPGGTPQSTRSAPGRSPRSTEPRSIASPRTRSSRSATKPATARTRSSATCRRRCTRSSASSGPRTSWTERWWRSRR